jgi:hypothetical protein
MMQEKYQHREVASAVSRVKSAFRGGKLKHYRPLVATGAEEAKSTCTASWGPAMRR